jgi:Zn-dependent protease with chaperone function
MHKQPQSVTPDLQMLREQAYHQQRTQPLRPILKNVSRSFFQGSQVWLASPDDPRERSLIDHVADACLFHNIKEIPQIVVVKSRMANAASVIGGGFAFSTGILDHMNEAELRAVVGHELSHHRQRSVDLGVMVGLIGLTEFGTRALRIHPTQWARNTLANLSVFQRVKTELNILMASLVMSSWAINPYRWKMELKSDHDGAQFESPKAMGDALEVLRQENQKIARKEWQESSLPKKIGMVLNMGVSVLFSPLGSHPPTGMRIRLMRHQEARQPAPPPASGLVATYAPGTQIHNPELAGERVEGKDMPAPATIRA